MGPDDDRSREEAVGERLDVQGQFEMLGGMICPRPPCDGRLKHDDRDVWCGRCDRLIVRFE